MAEHKCHTAAAGAGGMIWFGGWLFTIGYLHLPFWRAVLGLVVWPYFLGAHFAPLGQALQQLSR